jgi:hypothetical protein
MREFGIRYAVGQNPRALTRLQNQWTAGDGELKVRKGVCAWRQRSIGEGMGNVGARKRGDVAFRVRNVVLSIM